MSLNDTQPVVALTGDFIRITNEEEPLKHLIGRSMRIGKIKSGDKNNRIYQLIDYNDKPVILVTADGERIEYWVGRDNFEVERRVVKGEDVFFQMTKKKMDTRGDAGDHLETAAIKVDVFSSVFQAMLDWIKK